MLTEGWLLILKVDSGPPSRIRQLSPKTTRPNSLRIATAPSPANKITSPENNSLRRMLIFQGWFSGLEGGTGYASARLRMEDLVRPPAL